jgi:hypothetical protein
MRNSSMAPFALFLVMCSSNACGPHGEARSAGGGAEPGDAAIAESADARAVEEPPASGCAATFVAARTMPGCRIDTTPSCRYAEGECTCVPPPQCGGAMMPPPHPGDPGSWRCGSSDPAVLDEAGCPYVMPKDGAQCPSRGKSCSYGACSWAQTIASCQGGVWHVEQHFMPPPP